MGKQPCGRLPARVVEALGLKEGDGDRNRGRERAAVQRPAQARSRGGSGPPERSPGPVARRLPVRPGRSQRAMSGGPFFSTNVIAYLLSSDERKADIAERRLAKAGTISVQVLNELANVARRKIGLTWGTAELLAGVRYLSRRGADDRDDALGMALAERHGFRSTTPCGFGGAARRVRDAAVGGHAGRDAGGGAASRGESVLRVRLARGVGASAPFTTGEGRCAAGGRRGSPPDLDLGVDAR